MTNRVDSFDRANASTLGTPSDAGSDWVALAGTFSIFSNKGQWSTGNPGVAYLESDAADVVVSAKMGAPGGSTKAGLAARITDANNFLIARWNAFTPGWEIVRYQSGASTVIATPGGSAYTAGALVEFELSGSTLRLRVAGVQIGSDVTSTFNQTATKHGLQSTGVSMTWDDFAITAVAADTTPPTLTSPTGTSTGSTTASGSVSTNEANGTLYYLASTNATETAATVKAASSQAVSATGTQSVSFTGLTASTTYYAHFVHRDAAGNDSTVASSASFTTSAAGTITGSSSITLGAITSVATGTVSALATITSQALVRNNGSQPGARTLTWVAVLNASTGAHVLTLTSVAVNSSGVFSVPYAGLTSGVEYQLTWRESTGERGCGWGTAA